MSTKPFILVVLLGVLVLGLTGASESQPLPGSEPDTATTELTGSQNRSQLLERRQLLPRAIPDEVHGQIQRESQRARRAITIFLVTCLAFLVFLVLPLFEGDKVSVDRPLGTDETHVHRV